jgi:hypothetical protein
MSQTYVYLSTQDLDDSDDHINNTHDALRSSFSGTSAPTSPTPVAGQWHFDLNDNIQTLHQGTDFIPMLDAGHPYGKLLHRSLSINYPMLADLHMGTTNKIRDLADGTADTDGVNLRQVRDDFIDQHYHSGVDNDGPKVPWYNLGLLGTEAADSLLELNYGRTAVQNRVWAANDDWTGGLVSQSGYAEMHSLTCYCWANQLRLVIVHFKFDTVPIGAGANVLCQLTYALADDPETSFHERTSGMGAGDRFNVMLVDTVRIPASGTYTFRLNTSNVGPGTNVNINSITMVVL